MNFIKNLIKKISDNYIAFFKNYLATNILIIITTIALIFCYDDNDLITVINRYAIFLIGNAFTIENFIKNKEKRYIGYPIGLIIAVILGFLFDVYEEDFYNFFYFYMVSAPLINIYHIVKINKQETSDYLYHVINNLITTTIINIALYIGVFAVIGIIDVLLIPNSDIDIYARTGIALVGFYTVPAYMYAFINSKSKIIELTNILLKFVLIPLTLISIVIVYLYLLKILITGDVPKNSVYSIIFVLFLATAISFNILKEFNYENKFIKFLDNNISYIFIPLYILQVYSLVVRINDYGFTEARYVGSVILVIEACILFLMKFKNKKHLAKILLITSALSLVTFVIPGINYEDVSINSQAKRINRILKDKELEDLNIEEFEDVYSIYYYLRSKDALDKVEKEIDQDDLIKNNQIHYDRKTTNYERKNKEISIEGYKTIEKITAYSYNNTNGIILVREYQVDLNETITKIDSEEIKNTDQLIIKLDDEKDLVVESLYVYRYNNKESTIDLSGFILKR